MLLVALDQDGRSQIVIRQGKESPGSGSDIGVVDGALGQYGNDGEENTKGRTQESGGHIRITGGSGISTPVLPVTN